MTRGQADFERSIRDFWRGPPAPTPAQQIAAMRAELVASKHVSLRADEHRASAYTLLTHLENHAHLYTGLDCNEDAASMAGMVLSAALAGMCAADDAWVAAEQAEREAGDRRYGNSDVPR